MSRLWDLIVVGAGPAGGRAAELFATAGADVLLLDPKAPWEKPCGGGLTAAALRNTPELLELTAEGQFVRELVVVAPSGASAIVPLRRPYLVVSRLSLARWSLDRAQAAGAHFLGAAVGSVERRGGLWYVHDSRGATHRCRWLLGADGATSRLRRTLAPQVQPELAPARVTYPRVRPHRHRAVFVFFPSTDGYLWDFPRPDHRSVGVGVPPRTYPKAKLDAAIAHYEIAEFGERIGNGCQGAVIATWNWRSGSFSDLAGRYYALLGDAAGLADPATGEGIDYALRSAALAFQAFDRQTGFEAYPTLVTTDFGAEFRRARLIRHWFYRPGLAEWMVRQARRSGRAAHLLSSLTSALNEHRSLRRAFFQAMLGRPFDQPEPSGECSCEPGAGVYAPIARPNGVEVQRSPVGASDTMSCPTTR
jgi:flavin-dependent dehydrogenase